MRSSLAELLLLVVVITHGMAIIAIRLADYSFLTKFSLSFMVTMSASVFIVLLLYLIRNRNE